MTGKVLVIAAIAWMGCILGGALWGVGEPTQNSAAPSPLQAAIDLYTAGRFRDALAYCAPAEQNEVADARELLYLSWTIYRRTDQPVEAKRIQQIFRRRFGSDLLAADMSFSTAIDLVALGDYRAAVTELEQIEKEFPKAKVTLKATEIRMRLADQTERTTRSVSN